MVKIRKIFCLTFDIEEFDAAKNIPEEERYNVSFEGTKKILKILEEEKIKATFFITAKFALKYPKLVAEISKNNEVASHGYDHSHEYRKMDEETACEFLKKSREELEKITKKEVNGFRAPRMKLIKQSIVKKSGFKYDASLQPALMPGRRSDFFKPRKMHQREGITMIPSSVTPIARIPLMWYGFRNMPMIETKIITLLSLINNDYASTYFHPWEFMNIEKYDASRGIKKNTGEKLEKMLRQYIRWCKQRYDFKTVSEMITKG